jgi:16S rRNA processing protein RimM
MSGSPGDLLWAGKIVAPHGLKGEMRIHTSADRSPLLEKCRRFVVCHPDGRLDPRQVAQIATGKRGFFLRLKEVEGIKEAQKLCGCDILVDPLELPDDPQDSGYPFRLIGMAVRDRRSGDLGRVENFFHTAAHGILVVEGGFGEVLIPYIPQFLTSIDRDKGEIFVDLPEGLVDET